MASTEQDQYQSWLTSELESLHPSSFAWALACCRRRRQDAEDVLQQTYEKVISGKARFHGRSALKTWLFGVIRLTALEHGRWSFFRELPSGILGGSHENAGRPDLALASKEQQHLLGVALQTLSDRQREVLHLTFQQELTLEQAAQVMGVSIGTARQHYERGKKALLEKLGPDHGAGDTKEKEP